MHYSWRHRIHGIAAGAAAVILAASLAAGSSVRVRADQGEYQRVESTAGSSAGSGAGSGSTRTRGLTGAVNARSGDTEDAVSGGTSGDAGAGAGVADAAGARTDAAGAAAGVSAGGGTAAGDASRPGQTDSSDSGLANTNNAYLYDNSL